MTPPQIADSDGFPFQYLARTPYRPVDFADWRAGNLAFCFNHYSAIAHTGATVSQHNGAVPMGDGLAAKS